MTKEAAKNSDTKNSDINILIVDDDKNLANMLTMVLKAKDYNVEACNNPVEALQKIRTFNYQIIISDIKMPQMSGLELLQEIKKLSTFMQVIMITGYSSLELTLKCIDGGASDFLIKPFEDLDEVYDAVNPCVQKIRRWRKIAVQAGKLSKLDKFDLLK